MCFIKIYKENFYENLFEHHTISSLIHAVNNFYFEGENSLDHLNVNHEISSVDALHSYQLVPDYLDLKTQEKLINRKVFQKYGYGINLINCKSANEHLQKHCRTNFRGNVRRSIKKIESSFNINYKMFYGDISAENYAFLMDKFYEMLFKRFQQRNDKNLVLKNWEFYRLNAFKLINCKKASLFIIYNDQEPIACSLNFHFNNIFYFAIPTFNIDYYKFALGNIVIYKNIDWCINNNYNFFDMGYGGFENKLKWCNVTYSFEHCLLFSSKNVLGYLYASILKHKYQLINYLIEKNINTIYRNLKNYVIGKKKLEVLDYRILQNESIENDSFSINFNDDEYNYLKIPVYDFLYSNNEHVNNIKVFALDKEKTYVIKGTKNQIKIKID